jgi:hypothetical protein
MKCTGIEALSLLAVLGANIFAQSAGIPSFDQFPAEVFTGKPVPPVLTTKLHHRFRTMIREGAAKGPNFAGRFTIAEWGCGSACIDAVVIDARTGRVQDMPFAHLGYAYSLRYADGTNERDDSFKPLAFSPKSRLLIVRGCLELDKNCGAYYYEWTGSAFKLLRKFGANPIP